MAAYYVFYEDLEEARAKYQIEIKEVKHTTLTRLCAYIHVLKCHMVPYKY